MLLSQSELCKGRLEEDTEERAVVWDLPIDFGQASHAFMWPLLLQALHHELLSQKRHDLCHLSVR